MEVGKEPKVIEVEDSLKSYQNLVGGWIESVSLSEGVALILNEEGKLKHLPPNKGLYNSDGRIIDVLVGNLFICRVDDDGDFADFKDEDIKLVNKYLK